MASPAALEDDVLASVDSPLGRLGIVQTGDAITRLRWRAPASEASTPLLQEAVAQVEAYFERRLDVFDLPLSPSGSDFQRRVCHAMCSIPFGETRTYGWLAEGLGSSPQPVGNACGANSIPIIVPCHRVLSTKGLGGYSGQGGVSTKVRLLQHENAYPYLV